MWGVAHGWNTDQFDRSVVIGPKYSQLAGGNGGGDGRGVVGTLLGPEGADFVCYLVRGLPVRHISPVAGVGGGCGVGGRSFFENCTVDASIL